MAQLKIKKDKYLRLLSLIKKTEDNTVMHALMNALMEFELDENESMCRYNGGSMELLSLISKVDDKELMRAFLDYQVEQIQNIEEETKRLSEIYEDEILIREKENQNPWKKK